MTKRREISYSRDCRDTHSHLGPSHTHSESQGDRNGSAPRYSHMAHQWATPERAHRETWQPSLRVVSFPKCLHLSLMDFLEDTDLVAHICSSDRVSSFPWCLWKLRQWQDTVWWPLEGDLWAQKMVRVKRLQNKSPRWWYSKCWKIQTRS